MKANLINLVGERFERLLVLSRSENSLSGKVKWLCRCDCGNEKTIGSAALRSGATRSCGCFNLERCAELKTKHGMITHSAYGTWKSMMGRCHNSNDKDYADYGARGIVVCEAWHDMPTFAQDVGEKPANCSLERIDNSKGYEPSNCKWATPFEQGANKRNNHHLLIHGEVIHLAEVSRVYGIKESTLRNRLYLGMSDEDAVFVPVRMRRATS